MKHRSIVAVVLFSIVTLGIYDLFWLASTKKELNVRTHEHVPTMWVLLSPLLLLVLPIIAALAVQRGNSSSNAGVTAGTLLVFLGVGIVSIAFLVIPAVWLLKYSKAVNEYTNREISTAVAFILLWILRFIGLAVIQDKFNDMLASGVGPVATTAAPIAAASTAPTSYPQVMPAPAQQVVQPQGVPQSPVDPTSPGSYNQPSNPPQPPQSPQPPTGPLVQ